MYRDKYGVWHTLTSAEIADSKDPAVQWKTTTGAGDFLWPHTEDKFGKLIPMAYDEERVAGTP